MEKFDRTQEQMAAALGKSRSYIANSLRLLTLPQDVKELLADGRLTAGHARALITSAHASQLAATVVQKGLSVRETERLVKTGPTPPKRVRPRAEKDADTKALEGDLSATLGMRVSVDHTDGTEGGSVIIRYKSLDQLDDLCRLLAG